MPARAPSVSKALGPCLASIAVAALAGCGSAAVAELPPAASPHVSPPLSVPPTGRVIRLGPPSSRLAPGRTTSPGGAPDALAFDSVSGRVAVGLHRPAELALIDGATGEMAERVPLPAAATGLQADGGDVLVPAGAASRLLRVHARDGRVLEDVRLGTQPRAVVPAGGGGVLVAGAARGRSAGPGAPRGVLSALQGGRRGRSVPVGAEPVGVTRVDPGRVAVVSARERVVELLDAATLTRLGRENAGVGPTQAIAHERWLWVTDTRGDALLVFRTRPKLQLVRRVFLPGAPYAIALDTRKLRLWVTLTRTNELAELPAHGRPHELRRLPTVRQPNAVAVDPVTHRVFVGGRHDGELELIDPPPLR